MQDRDVVAAVVAGDADGIGEAYDRYAASLYAYCHSMLPGPEAAADAVQDTFVIAVSKLDGLRDPDQLDAWLHAVARNECLRQLGPGGPRRLRGPRGPAGAGSAVPGPADADDVRPAVTLPAGLRGRVVAACADSSPTGRAHRMSVAHRAGTFGPTGFPKAIALAGPRWWQPVRRHPGVLAAAAVLAVLALAAGITAIMTDSGSNRPQASALGLSGGVSGASSGPGSGSPVSGSPVSGSPISGSPISASPVSGRASAGSSPAHEATPAAPPLVPTATVPGGAPSPGPPAGQGTPSPSASPSSASPTPFPSPSPGRLLVAPDKLTLTAAQGKTVSGYFVLATESGPVKYAIKVPAAVAARVKVSPSTGSLPANYYLTVAVTVTSKVALNTYVTVEPGNLTVRVVLTIRA
jgi:DNA-directed RNA polymerase specialized sigma24 family protein